MAASDGSSGIFTQDSEALLVYDGRTGELFGLWLKTALLSLITLGFYRFWGRTRIRKYLWSRVSLNGDRFEYDGTGGELFRRFLVALVVLVPLLALPGVMELLGGSFILTAILHYAVLLLFLFLIQVGRYGGRRYRLTRTLWRGIRGGLDGSSVTYALINFKYFLLIPLTLGLAVPWQLVSLWRYEMNNTGLGDRQFSYEGSGRHLLKPWLVVYACAIASLVAICIIAVLATMMALSGGQSSGIEALDNLGRGLSEDRAALSAFAAAIVILWLLVMVAMGFSGLYFRMRTMRYLAGGTALGEVRFVANIRFWRLFRLYFGNALVMLLTLGMGSAFLAHRELRFVCRNVMVVGRAALDVLTQQPGRRQKEGGEGLLQLLDTTGFA